MNQKYQVKVNNTFHFDINNKDVKNLDALKISNTKSHVLKDHKTYKTEIVNSDFNKKSYKVKVNGNTYNVNISNALDLLIKEMGFSLGSIKHINSIKAPMPGLILDINVKVGQEIKEDDALLILEAMKMENVLTSPRDGVIKTISVTKGDAVEKNQLLIEFQ